MHTCEPALHATLETMHCRQACAVLHPASCVITACLLPAVLQDIDELCTECSALIQHHDKIKVLSAVHYNLGKTLQDVSNISELPAMAEDAEKLLSNDELLLQACPH